MTDDDTLENPFADPLSPGGPSSAFSQVALSEVTRLQLKASRAHRDGAQAMEEAAKAMEAAAQVLQKSIKEAQDSLVELVEAKEKARAEARRLRGQATSLSLEAVAQATQQAREAGSEEAARFPVAAMFEDADLAALKKYNAPGREQWKPGDEFSLVPDPLNKFDPNAIQVWRGGVQVGFIEKGRAEALKKMERQSGWVLSGKAFLKSRQGGHWKEGVLHVRLTNPVLGWEGYNPARSAAENLARMESELLSSAASPGPEREAGARRSARSL